MSSSIFRICANHRQRERTGTSPLTSGSDLRAHDEYVGATCDGFDHENEMTPSENGTKSRESIYGSSVRHSAERAAEARKDADRLAVSLGTSVCSVSKDRLSPLRPSATP